MKLAFCLFNYFAYGGLQRDFLRIATTCQARGHEIHVYTQYWEGETPPGFDLHLIPTKGWQNHTRNRIFSEKLQSQLQNEAYDKVIGFNKMPGLDWYYAADVCYQARVHQQRGLLYRLLPRYHQQLAFEKSVFAQGKATQIMLISPFAQQTFTQYYQTEPERLHLLPPGISKDRLAPPNAKQIRQTLRQMHQLNDDDFLLLAIGSGFKTKGLDRSLMALAALPPALQQRCHLFVIGEGNPKPFLSLARQLKIAKHLHFLGGRSDVPDLLLAGDLLLHPAYHENTGTVLLEAIISGLPVLTVDSCGYAHYVNAAKAGAVIAAPFQQAVWNATLENMLASLHQQPWRENGLVFAKQADIYSLPDKAADLIERVSCS